MIGGAAGVLLTLMAAAPAAASAVGDRFQWAQVTATHSGGRISARIWSDGLKIGEVDIEKRS